MKHYLTASNVVIQYTLSEKLSTERTGDPIRVIGSRTWLVSRRGGRTLFGQRSLRTYTATLELSFRSDRRDRPSCKLDKRVLVTEFERQNAVAQIMPVDDHFCTSSRRY